eukprot:748105-Hanusia_phi.AAC.2
MQETSSASSRACRPTTRVLLNPRSLTCPARLRSLHFALQSSTWEPLAQQVRTGMRGWDMPRRGGGGGGGEVAGSSEGENDENSQYIPPDYWDNPYNWEIINFSDPSKSLYSLSLSPPSSPSSSSSDPPRAGGLPSKQPNPNYPQRPTV